MKEIVITSDQAVFWMDARGRWCNVHGPFEHPRIISYFNSAMRRDDRGWFVEQILEDACEKVYFRYVDTPLFGVDVIDGDPRLLVLNTGKKILLEPELLFIHNERLFQRHADGCIKFNDHVLIKLSESIECRQGGTYFCERGRTFRIPEE